VSINTSNALAVFTLYTAYIVFYRNSSDFQDSRELNKKFSLLIEQTTVFKGRHFSLCMKVHLKLRIQSIYIEDTFYNIPIIKKTYFQIHYNYAFHALRIFRRVRTLLLTLISRSRVAKKCKKYEKTK